MPLLLVRHAVAQPRRGWSKADWERPLTEEGEAQANGLVELLLPFEIERIWSSPFVRCVDTVVPLAERLGLPVEPFDELAEGAGASVEPLISQVPGVTIVLCTHGDVVPELLDALARDTAPKDGERPCAKGSTWVIDDDGAPPRYLPPPPVSQ